MLCGACSRSLDQPDDPLSADCGGDCRGCLSQIEADLMGVDLEAYRRDPWGVYEAVLRDGGANVFNAKLRAGLLKWAGVSPI